MVKTWAYVSFKQYSSIVFNQETDFVLCHIAFANKGQILEDKFTDKTEMSGAF